MAGTRGLVLLGPLLCLQMPSVPVFSHANPSCLSRVHTTDTSPTVEGKVPKAALIQLWILVSCPESYFPVLQNNWL